MKFNYRHKVSGELLATKRILGSVGVFYIEKPYYFDSNILIDTCICSMDNIELITNQQKLF